MAIKDLHQRITALTENEPRKQSLHGKIKLAEKQLRAALQRWDNCYSTKPIFGQSGTVPCRPSQELEDEISARRKHLKAVQQIVVLRLPK